MVFKKDLTPIGRGGITKHDGKGSAPPNRGSVFDRVTNRYPKPTPPAPASAPALAPAPAAMPVMAPPRRKGFV